MPDNSPVKKAVEEGKKRAKDFVKGLILHAAPWVLLVLVIVIFLAWIVEFMDMFKFDNMFNWLKGTDSGYMVDSQRIYHIVGHLDDYEYKLINEVEDEYDEDLFKKELKNAHFDPDLFTSGSEENKVIYRLIKNGLDISEYSSEEELKCLPLFIKASVSNSSPYLGLTTGELKGKIEIYRQKENLTDFQQLKFIKKEELQAKIAADRNNARKYFSLTNDGKIIVAVHNSTEEEWSFPGLTTEAQKRHPDWNRPAVSTPEYKELSLEYQNIIGPHTISFEFLHAMLIKTKDPAFCTELANNVIYDGSSNPIKIYIYDNTTIETTVVDTTYRGQLKREYKYNCNITYTDIYGNVYQDINWPFYLKTPPHDYFDTEPYTYKHQYKKITTYDNPIIVLQEANSLFYSYTKPICTTNTPPIDPITVTNPYGGEQPKAPGNPHLETSPIILEHTAGEEAKNLYQTTYPERIVNSIWFGWIGSTGISKGNIYKYFLTEEKEEVITITQNRTEYTESDANVAFNEGDKSFYKTFTDEKYEDARSAIYETDISLFQMLGFSSKASYFIDLLKYTMWRESGKNYGVTTLELLNILEQVKLSSVYQSTASQVLQFNVKDSTYFITDPNVLASALSGYPELQQHAELLIQYQTQYNINAMAVASACIMQTQGGANLSVATTNNLFGILNPDGSIKIYLDQEDSIKDFYEKLNNQINTNTVTNTSVFAATVFENSQEDQIEWKKHYDAIILEIYKKQSIVDIPTTLQWGTPTLNPNMQQDGYVATYPSKSGRVYKEWAQNMGPWGPQQPGQKDFIRKRLVPKSFCLYSCKWLWI